MSRLLGLLRPRGENRGYVLIGLGLFVVLEAMLVVAIIWWPTFKENSAAVRNLAGPIAMLQEWIDLMDAFGAPAYVVFQHFFKAGNTLGVAAAVMFAVGAVAGEAHRGTLEIWLARPVTRLRLYSERWVKGALAVTLPMIVSSLTAVPLLSRYNETMGYQDVLLCAALQSLFLLAIYSTTFMFSAFSSTPLKLGIWMLFAVIFQFAIYLVEGARDFSIFQLVDMQTYMALLNSGQPDPVVLGTLGGWCLVTFAVGLIAFRRRVP